MMKFIDLDDSWGEGILQDWYIHSVNPDDIPQWTDEHIEELCKDFYVIPKETTKYDIDCDLDRLKELAEADKEGRCLVLPCKVGDVIYVLTTDSLTGIEETKCTGIRIRSKNKVVIKAPCTYDDWGNAWRELTLSDFGKKIFLTKEEAERALEAIEK